VENWFSAPEAPVARIGGGPAADGTSGGWELNLTVGSRVGAFFTKATPENRDHYYMSAIGTFNAKPDGGYTNGELYKDRVVTEMELTQIVRGAAASQNECEKSEP